MLVVVLLGVGCVRPPPPSAGDEVFDQTVFIDPIGGLDRSDGLSERSPIQSFEGLRNLRPRTRVLIKRGSVMRVTGLKLRGGDETGWISWGAYGDAGVPKPILMGSIQVGTHGSVLDGGFRGILWPQQPNVDGGVEIAPGNLWFFDLDGTMTGWGWRKESLADVKNDGDWFFDGVNQQLLLRWTGPLPIVEASLNTTQLDFSGQNNVIVEDWDLRYFGGYAMRGHEANHVRVRRVDMSFGGGGTKTAQYVRLGNGFETTGNVDDVVVEQCRFHQLYDTAFDPQNVSGAATQRHLTFRDNLISRMGLAGMELWLRPAGTTLEDVTVTGNVFMNTGRGWGYEQHDHPGTVQLGADLFISRNEASTARITISGNTFHQSRAVLVSEFHEDAPLSRSLLRGLSLDDNTWSSVDSPAVVLFTGSVGADGKTELGESPTFATLAEWQRNALVPGKDARSVEGPAVALPVERTTVKRVGPFVFDP